MYFLISAPVLARDFRNVDIDDVLFYLKVLKDLIDCTFNSSCSSLSFLIEKLINKMRSITICFSRQRDKLYELLTLYIKYVACMRFFNSDLFLNR